MVEVIGLATPIVSDKFGGLETGRRWLSRLGVDQAVGQRGG